MTNFCTFYIVRHGETEWNVKDIIQGQSDSPLTKNGINQAKKLAALFKNIKFDQVFSSDLLRAKRTAELVALEHKMVVKTSQLLRERRFGKWQGRKAQEMKKELKDAYRRRNQLAKKERFLYLLDDDIETDEDMIRRFITFLRETAILFPAKKVLVVSHGGVMRKLLIHLGFAKYDELPGGSISNTGYIIIESDGVDLKIKETIGVKKKA